MLNLLHDLVLVLPIAEKVTTETGIVLVDFDKAAPRQGLVVKVGPGKVDSKGVRKPVSCKPGDRIVYVYNNVRDIKVENDTLHVVPDSEILCVLETEK